MFNRPSETRACRDLRSHRSSASTTLLGPLGCGIQIGTGAVINVCKLRAGSPQLFVAFGLAQWIVGGAATCIAGATTMIPADVVHPTHFVYKQRQDAVPTIQGSDRAQVFTLIGAFHSEIVF